MTPGENLFHKRIPIEYIAVVRIPGMIPAINNFPIDVSVMIPYKTKAMLGGIIIASVPETVTTPVATLSE
jgi:hypothetical protein